MKQFLLLCLCLFLSAAVWAQKSCCSTDKPAKDTKAAASHCTTAPKTAIDKEAPMEASATVQFASLANDTKFRASHEQPLAYTHQTTKGREMIFPTPDGKTAKAFIYMAPKRSDKYLLVIHEWWGLNDHIKREAEKLYTDLDSVNVIALDMYDGKVATTQEEAQKYMQSVKEERGKAIVQGAITFAKKGSTAPKIGTIGWCFGGGWSLQAALLAGEQAAACVMYYGMPITDATKLKKLDCEVLGIFARQDGWITPKVAEDFKQAMEKADKKLQLEMYDAKHAFANPSNPAYDQQATEDAYEKTLAFLREHLQ